MIYKQLSYLPIIFQVDEGIILKVKEFLQRNKLFFSNVLTVSGKSFSSQFAQQLAKENSWQNYIVEGNSFDDVGKLRYFCDNNRHDLILAIGGGKVLDVVKRVSYLSNINHLSIPTIISNDGLISPISVIKNSMGFTESLPGMMPMGVVIDLEIIQNSPLNYIRAAAGDILSNISATNDWILACKNKKDDMNDIGFHLSKSAANSLLYFNKIDLTYKPFLRTVIQGQINSGIAMSLAGTSRPCSGSEHLISHALDSLKLCKGKLHGIQVASLSLFTLYLQNRLHDVHINYAIATGIPLCFTDLIEDCNEDVLKTVYNLAKEMRPGRYTILDEISSNDFVAEVFEYTRRIGILSASVASA